MTDPDAKQPTLIGRLVRRFRWWIAGPVLRPIIADCIEASENAKRSAQMKNTPREWQIECLAKGELYHVHAIELELAFGCISFDAHHRTVRHYS